MNPRERNDCTLSHGFSYETESTVQQVLTIPPFLGLIAFFKSCDFCPVQWWWGGEYDPYKAALLPGTDAPQIINHGSRCSMRGAFSTPPTLQVKGLIAANNPREWAKE